jgi:hypothetical protein
MKVSIAKTVSISREGHHDGVAVHRVEAMQKADEKTLDTHAASGIMLPLTRMH